MITNLANERFAVDIIEVLDNLERAIKADDAHLREGIVQIQQCSFHNYSATGILPVESLKKTFNPGEHEAIALVPSDAEEEL